MWIVRLALRRPYTFIVVALLIFLLSPFVLQRTPTDIFPVINIPVISVIWTYNGLSPGQIEQRIVYPQERAMTTTVNNIEHIESTSYYGVGVIKVFFQQGTSPLQGLAQITSVSQTILKQLPPGSTPPQILQFSASTVPILEYGISSSSLSQAEIYDLTLNEVRVGLVSVPGVSIPLPYGGEVKVVSVDLDPKGLEANNVSPSEVISALDAQNLVFPSGVAEIGATQYTLDLNASPQVLDQLNYLPVKKVGAAVVLIRDVAQVHAGYLPQQNMVRLNGVPSTLLSIFKSGSASTLRVASGVEAAMPRIQKTLTGDLQVKQFANQAVFVSAAISSVVREMSIAGILTALMILLFVGVWRSTLIVCVSIPLAILTSLTVLSALGETINLMTLGGLALAVGILVDDATVEIENDHRQMASGKPLEQAILDGAQEIAMPAMVSTLCICIVFVPMFLLTGVARYLFVPFAEAVVFALLASYLLSRTIVPTLVMYFYRHHPYHEHPVDSPRDFKGVTPWLRPFVAIHDRFERGFTKFRAGYGSLLEALLNRRAIFIFVFLGFCLASWLLVLLQGQDFFPTVDAGLFELHVRGPTGMRLQSTAELVDRVEAMIRREISAKDMQGVLDNIGFPVSGINLSFNNSGIIGTADADILVSLKPGARPTSEYVRHLRIVLNREFPGTTFYFLPADIVAQTINFGLPAPIDIQFIGRDQAGNRQVATRLATRLARVPGAVDFRVQQPDDQPNINFAINRIKAAELGLTERDVADSVMLNLTGSGQTQPNFWVNPKVGVEYLVSVMTPQYRMDSLPAIKSMPVNASVAGRENVQLLGNLASYSRANTAPIFSHYGVMPVIDVYGSVAGRDLGGVMDDIRPLIRQAEKELPAGSSIQLRGQVNTMRSSFIGLGMGLAAAVVLIYLLLVINFQSWLDPFIILTALTGALAGVLWGLHVTNTTLSVPAMMGAIMSLGVATSNSVLVVTFARDNLKQGMVPLRAAWEAGVGRLRPVLMTALAMIIGMIPMALGMGAGGQQNAPLGRAVIGGLLIATITTLFFVPVIFSLLHRRT